MGGPDTVFLALLVCVGLGVGCGGAAGQPDLAGAGLPDLVTSPDQGLENAACEAELASAWIENPPTTGVGPPAAAGPYVQVVARFMADYSIPGGTVAVTRNGKLVLARGIGFADRDGLQPAHPDQLFRLASVSKQITAAAVLALVRQGKLDLDEPAFAILGSDLPPLPGKEDAPQLARITVRHLLNHTGGWNRDFEAVGDPMFRSPTIAAALGQPGPASCADTIRWMRDKPLTYPPGTVDCYSNFGYCVLGRIIEKRGGAPYDTVTKAAVLGPAGATRMRLGRTLLANRADDEVRYYPFPGEGLAQSIFPSMPGPIPWEYGGWAIEAMDAHGGWIASAVDLLHFATHVDGHTPPADVLDAASLAQMTADPGVPSCNADGTFEGTPGYWYGFGWSVNKYGNLWHTGSLDGTATEDVIASSGLAWAALFNGRPRDGGYVGRIDNDLWTPIMAIDQAGGWPTDDYFDQFPATGFDDWRAAADFSSELATRLGAGQYPVRLEGRLDGGAVRLRAEWAPLHRSMKVSTATQLDCLTYRTRDAELRARGYSPVSIQSFLDGAGHAAYQATWAAYP